MTRNDLPEISPKLLHLCRADGAVATAPPPGICIYHRDATSPKESYLYDPVLCVLLQGAKTMRSGDV